MSGKLLALNQEVLKDPSINVDSYGTGWLFEIKGDTESTMDVKAYFDYLASGWENPQRILKAQVEYPPTGRNERCHQLPGMNPYLENENTWHNFHSLFPFAVFEMLVPQVRPKYYIATDEHVYIHELPDQRRRGLGKPDVSIAESKRKSSETPLRHRIDGANGSATSYLASRLKPNGALHRNPRSRESEIGHDH